ncbi:hypothetical protein [Aliihoeflea sp. PC F10.4]
MLTVAAIAAIGAPVILANERSLFHFGGPEDVRLQAISRSGDERSWPFTVDHGSLACTWSAGQKVVIFIPDEEEGMVFVSTNPMDAVFLNMANRHLVAETETVEDLIVRMGPFESLGRRLCDQPRGTHVGPGEL